MKGLHYRSFALAIVLGLLASIDARTQALDLTEIMAKHRSAVGARESLSAVKNQLIVFDAQFSMRGSANVIYGKGLILSTSEKSLFGMNFASNDYPQDRFGYDGKDVRVARATASARSLLGDFLYNNREIVREGLLGGTLSASWPLLQDGLKNAKVRFEGRKTLDDREVLVLSYSPRSGSDLDMRIYLDDKTFQLVRTDYTLVRNAGQGPTVDSSAGQSGTINKLVEEFDDFSKAGPLTLPRTYKLTYSRTGTASFGADRSIPRESVWTFKVTDFGLNRDIDETLFKVEAK